MNMDGIDVLNSALDDINGLTLQGAANWKRAAAAIQKIAAVVAAMEKDRERREAAYQASADDAETRNEKD